MQAVKTIGLDIAKSVFQVHGVDADGQLIIRRKLKRRYVLAFFQKVPSCLIGMEAQLLHELVPIAKLFAVLINPTSPAYSDAAMESALNTARVLGINLLPLNASTPGSIEAAFATLKKESVGALLVTGDSFLVAQRAQLAALAAKNAVPTLSAENSWVPEV